MMTRQQFYKSKKWLDFRKVIVAQRTDADGYVHCADCGKPIVKPYDLIIHHKQELSEANVNDATIALNPANVEIVCFRCHNKEHERFGFNRTSAGRNVKKHVYIVYGSPCSGKSSWVSEVADPEDLVVDLDNIWQMVSINKPFEKPAALRSVVFQIRDALYDVIKYRSGKWHNAYVITGGALQGDRDRLQQRIGADDLIFIDTTQEECVKRIQLKFDDPLMRAKWYEYIVDWFQQYQPEYEHPPTMENALL